MIKSNIPIIFKMAFNKDCFRIFIKSHKLFSANKRYKLKYLLASAKHVVKNDKIKLHNHNFVVNSFLPPINSKAFETMLMGVDGKDDKFYEDHISGKRKAPISMYISATSNCMYNCWHCSAAKRNSGTDIETSKFLKLIRDLQNMGVSIIGFTGGEPLLRHDLEEIISEIDKRSISFVFSTGFGLSYERAMKLKRAGLFGIAISVDSIDEKEHDKKRGFEGAHKEAIEAIINAKKAGLYTMSQTVCTKEMLKDDNLFKFAEFLSEYGVDEMRIIEPLPCGKLDKEVDVLLSEEEKRIMIQFHIDCNRKTYLPKASVFGYVESSNQFGCGAGVQHSYIDSHGNLYPCDFVPLSFGNVLEEPVDALWRNMNNEIEKPNLNCFSKKHLNEILNNEFNNYPVSSKTLPPNCLKCKEAKLPRFYRILGGND